MKTNFISFLASSLLLFSCGNSTTENPIKESEPQSQQTHQHDEQKDVIKLNHGEKWSVNPEMSPYILESETILNNYTETKSNNYKQLAEQLTDKNSGLVNSCTMKGESHDELHKWLHPHMELIESLSNAENSETAQALILELQKSFETYHKYFQ